MTLPAPMHKRPAWLSQELAELEQKAAHYAAESLSPATRRGYASDWKNFCRWCARYGHAPLPATPQTVSLYLTWMAEAGRSPAHLDRIRAAIHAGHRLTTNPETKKSFPSPTSHAMIRSLMQGIKRSLGEHPRRRKKAAPIDSVLLPMLSTMAEDARGIRDRAVILVGFAGAFRREELASLELADVAFEQDGAAIRLLGSKTDKTKKGVTVPIPRGSRAKTCPVQALARWISLLASHDIRSGKLFRGIDRHGNILQGCTGQTIYRLVRRAAERAGLDHSLYGAHSLRSGFATQAALRKKHILQIAQQGRWKRLDQVREYYQEIAKFDDSAAKDVGL